jgi:hypothetical protein
MSIAGSNKRMILGIGLDDNCPICDKPLLELGKVAIILTTASLTKEGSVVVQVTHDHCRKGPLLFDTTDLGNNDAIAREFDAVKYGEGGKPANV